MSDNEAAPQPAFPPLEEPCNCRGELPSGRSDWCRDCKGWGRRPTEFGRSVLKLLEPHLWSMFRDARDREEGR